MNEDNDYPRITPINAKHPQPETNRAVPGFWSVSLIRVNLRNSRILLFVGKIELDPRARAGFRIPHLHLL